MVGERFEVYLISLDPTIGSEMKKTRPGLVLSPDEMNRHLQTVIVAPLTTVQRGYPSRIRCGFQDQVGEICLDHIRSVDCSRLVRRLGRMDTRTGLLALARLREIFGE